MDSAVERAGAGYAGYHRIRGFPYLRSDRMLASFGDRVKTFDAFDAWTWELRENDGFARNIELANMGMPDLERANLLTDLRLCAVWLSNTELMDADTLRRVYLEAQLPARVTPPDPSVMPLLDQQIREDQAAVKADFAKTDRRAGVLPLVLWQATKTAHSSEPPKLSSDPLGRVGLTPTDWQEMAEKFAPNLLIETEGGYDLIGAPSWSAAGTATVDTQRHYVYFMPSYARVGGRTLIQITYFVWFSERVGGSKLDPRAGRLDGLMWRVTFDPEGNPLLFDSMHMSGFDQMWFVPSNIGLRSPLPANDDPVLVAQTVNPGMGLTVRLHSGSHTPLQVVDQAELSPTATSRAYELHAYDDLMTLPLDHQRTRSFFNSNGIVAGTERQTPIKTAGIPNAGSMRQWGNQPTAISGRHFFDDPGLIDHLFILPIKALESPKETTPPEQVPSGHRNSPST